MNTSLFLHAHPDDEAIFTGGTIALLKERGHKVIVVFATRGQLGHSEEDVNIAQVREEEARDATQLLGVDECLFLDFHDSGLDPTEFPVDAFATSDVDRTADTLAQIISEHNVNALFCDDVFGIYGHPDHVQAHKVGTLAAEISRVSALFYTTVDREYLHFVETHLVEEAHASHPHESTVSDSQKIGMSSVEITHTINAHRVLDTKRASMAAHKSQINDTSSAFTMNDEDFQNVYGYEWFVRAHLSPGSPDILTDL
jgi:LmbE family N-acetylglucosaminyl deacetylase